jgi:hypothetical protein
MHTLPIQPYLFSTETSDGGWRVPPMQTLGNGHRSASPILKDYGLVLKKLKRKHEAQKVERRAQAILSRKVVLN